jgi:hypothetical protein
VLLSEEVEVLELLTNFQGCPPTEVLDDISVAFNRLYVLKIDDEDLRRQARSL